MKIKSYKCDLCGKEMDVPVLTMIWKNQEEKHYCEDCIGSICMLAAYTFWYFNNEDLAKSFDKTDSHWKGCENCCEKSKI